MREKRKSNTAVRSAVVLGGDGKRATSPLVISTVAVLTLFRISTSSLIFFGVFSVFISAAEAATTRTWSGTTSTNFELSTNWGGTVPANDLTSDIGTFSNAPPANQPALTIDRSIAGLLFSNATGGYVLSGVYNLTLGANGISDAGQTSGTTTISVATLTLGAAQTFNAGGSASTASLSVQSNVVNAGNPLTLAGNSGTSLMFSGSISGNGGVTKTGGSVATLTGGNTYTGTTTISAGTLQLGNGGSTGTLSTVSAIVDNAVLTFDRSNAVVQGTDFSSASITGSGALIQAGANNLTLNTANGYTGATTVSSGSLTATNSQAFGTGAGTLNVGNATLNLLSDEGVGAVTGQTTIFGGASATSGYNVAATTGASTFFVNSNGNGGSSGNTIQLGTLSTNKVLAFTNSNGYSLRFGAVTTTSSATFNNNFSNGVLTLGGFNDSSSSNGNSVVFNETGSSGTTAVTDVISQNGLHTLILTQTGSGKLILSGNNTYSGGTTISGGTLEANTTGMGTSATGSAGVTVSSGGTLAGGTAQASGQVGGTVLVTNGTIATMSGTTTTTPGGVITAGTGATQGDAIGTLTTGVETWTGGNNTSTTGGTLYSKIANSGGAIIGNDKLIMSGLVLNASSTSKFNVNVVATGGSFNYTPGTELVLADDTSPTSNPFSSATVLTNFNLTVTNINDPGRTLSLYSAFDGSGGYDLVLDDTQPTDATPEPTSAILLGLASLPMLAERRRRKSLMVAAV